MTKHWEMFNNFTTNWSLFLWARLTWPNAPLPICFNVSNAFSYSPSHGATPSVNESHGVEVPAQSGESATFGCCCWSHERFWSLPNIMPQSRDIHIQKSWEVGKEMHFNYKWITLQGDIYRITYWRIDASWYMYNVSVRVSILQMWNTSMRKPGLCA